MYSGRERVRIKYFSATGMAGGGLVGSDAWCKMVRMKMVFVMLIEYWQAQILGARWREDEDGVDLTLVLVSYFVFFQSIGWMDQS